MIIHFLKYVNDLINHQSVPICNKTRWAAARLGQDSTYNHLFEEDYLSKVIVFFFSLASWTHDTNTFIYFSSNSVD